jgi:hypothetical protein
METTLLLTSFIQINLFTKISDYFVSNEIQALCIGFGGATLIYFLILLGYLVKKRYENYSEAFFLSLSLGGALFMLSLKVFPILLNFGPFTAAIILLVVYLALVPLMFKIVRRWNSNRVYVFED